MKNIYIINLKDSQAYIKSIDNKKINYTFDIKNAKKYEKQEASKIIESYPNLEIVQYNRELYKIKNERFKLFVKALLSQENTDIMNIDIEIFQKETKNKGFLVACNNLKQKYSNNKLINEMERISQKIEFQNHYKRNPGKKFSESYDFDDERELEILKLAFNDKYITKELIEDEENQFEE